MVVHSLHATRHSLFSQVLILKVVMLIRCWVHGICFIRVPISQLLTNIPLLDDSAIYATLKSAKDSQVRNR